MSGEDLYLIRTEKLVLRGPMSAAALRQKLKAMEFALSDEVSGNLSPWVKLEDLSAMKKYCPKLLIVLAEDIPGAQKVINEATARMMEKKIDRSDGPAETQKKKIAAHGGGSKRALLSIALAITVCLSAGAGLYQMRKAKQAAVSLSKDLKTLMQQARDLHLSGQYPAFVKLLAGQEEKLISGMQSQRTLTQDIWQILRAYHILSGYDLTRVEVPGVMFAPGDINRHCHTNGWRQFYEKNVAGFLGNVMGDDLDVNSFYQRMLVADKQWLDRRQSPEWLGFRNEYLACLNIAERVFESLANSDRFDSLSQEKKFLLVTAVRDRFRVLLARDAAAREVYKYATYVSPFVFLNCLDTAWNSGQLEECEEVRGSYSLRWNEFLDHTSQYRGLAAKLVDHVERSAAFEWGVALASEPLKISYQEEAQFVASAPALKGDYYQADVQIRQKYPNFFFHLSPQEAK